MRFRANHMTAKLANQFDSEDDFQPEVVKRESPTARVTLFRTALARGQ